MNTTLLAIIDNHMDEKLHSLCMDYLKWSADGLPIISISQKPVDLGTNICVGDIGRSVENFWMQILIGAEAATTEYVAIVEQDNFYPKGYFDFMPSRRDTFYYNFNYVILHYSGELHGQFGVNNEIRTAASQLICNRSLLVSALTWVVGELDRGRSVNQAEGLIVEPGSWEKLFVGEYTVPSEFTKFDLFWDEWPSIDMRHDRNFTKQRRFYKMLSDKVVYWGAMADIENYKPMEEPCLML